MLTWGHLVSRGMVGDHGDRRWSNSSEARKGMAEKRRVEKYMNLLALALLLKGCLLCDSVSDFCR